MKSETLKVIFLDHDGVICLSHNQGNRFKKRAKDRVYGNPRELPVEYRFDNFDKGAISILNEIISITNCEIVVSSDWRFWANLEEMGDYYQSKGIIKRPISFTKSLGEFEDPKDFIYEVNWDLEQCRSLEIKNWLKENPQVTNWVAVDDLNMGKVGKRYHKDFVHDWGLDNFVLCSRSNEGIKQLGVKEKILKYL